MRAWNRRGAKHVALIGAVGVTLGLLWSSAVRAETKVYLLRGWFGVFSTGLDTIADDLNKKGIKAETVGHLSWQSTVSEIVKARAANANDHLVLVGHSQGANNVIDMARQLEKEKIPVDLLVTLAPMMQDPVPRNVAWAINYYHSPGWGAPVSAEPGYRGKLSNVNLGGDVGISHMTMDKSSKIQGEIERAILAVAQPK